MRSVIHVWSTRHRTRAVRNGLQRCIVAQVAAAILRKQAAVQTLIKMRSLATPAALGEIGCSPLAENGAASQGAPQAPAKLRFVLLSDGPQVVARRHATALAQAGSSF
jgi:hypothetical protein